MRRRVVMAGSVAAGAAALLAGVAVRPAAAQPAPASLDESLRPFLARYGLPALFAAVVREGRIVAAGAVGTRRAGTEIPVTLNDRVHIGSCTKAMTALLAGMLVDEGRIGWDATIRGSFPDLAEGMDAGLGGVTLEQLLSHVGGIPGDTDEIVALYVKAAGQEDLNLDAMRRWVIGQWRGHPLASPPGSRFAYANLGFLIAGAMLERAAGST